MLRNDLYQNTSLSTTHSITNKKILRWDEGNDDLLNGNNNIEFTGDDNDDHYDEEAGKTLLRNLTVQVLPS
ncbi:unnamed protein product [Didymodactylos carnosus]|uniref:Uncharacterized protein n=1 Tax=Didymodactylos carnosus TaxID=1234261 RepID=A0A814Z8G8_9BILA|nr:unnamed protein product [Didymodactylos carnosus]CAF1238966.1 unnamed protein product [Didymodactylos carnosus]CAF4001135.1 unnamed protein product [Didymodactylos carnosus]CAF4042210.1 unnamed protein product [Didymodactylos carnosus]